MDNQQLNKELGIRKEEVEKLLMSYLPSVDGRQKTVFDAVNYSVCAGGKRLRPILMMESFRMFGGTGTVIEPFAVAIEMIHTYSLVHDDLPAMDNDEFRRGKKTTHAKYGETMGILAGDALLNFAFETAMKAFDRLDDLAAVAKALRVLAQKAGMYGMLGGQVVDVEAEGRCDVTEDDLRFIHTLKTAAMIESSLMIGAILAGASDEAIENMEQIGRNVGIAFQIQDDILDVTGTLETLGKPILSDERNGKTTYVKIKGVEASSQEVRRLSDEAIDLLEKTAAHTDFMAALIRQLTVRNS
ncbi:MAG: polyprenyl synthetase family protein [bacterium]|nr:polyprenyl synthetase family protein [bacterium]